MPSYNGSKLRAYWESLHAIIDATHDRRILFVGDFNADPDRDTYLGTRYLRNLKTAGWRIPRPTGDWSCWTKANRHSRIDHVIASPSLSGLTASYATHGPVGQLPGAVSDHAALVVEVRTA